MQRKQPNPSLENVPLLVLTRPQSQSQEFVDEFINSSGIDREYLIAPLMRVQFLDVDLPVPDLPVVFTSANGVIGFTRLGLSAPRGVFCVGEVTRALALKAGLKVLKTFETVDALIVEMDAPIFYARGRAVSLDLVSVLAKRSIHADQAVFYSVEHNKFSPDALAIIKGRSLVVPVFSKNSAVALLDAFPDIGKTPCTVLAISGSVADVLRSQICGRVEVADAPTRTAMIAGVQRLLA